MASIRKTYERLLTKVKSLFISKEKLDQQRQEQFLLNITKTRHFDKMSPQDKMMALTKLLSIFRSDFGSSSEPLEKRLVSLNKKVKDKMHALWKALYSKSD